MTDIKVKTTTKRASSTQKSVKVKKIPASDKTSVATDAFIDEEDEFNSDEDQYLLCSALNIINPCYESEDEQEINGVTEDFQPVDYLMLPEMHSKISDYKKTGSVAEEDTQDYVTIGCRFPNGVVILLGKNKSLLRGINDMPNHEKDLHYENVGFTRLLRTVWQEFLKTHKNWPPILNGSIFVLDSKGQ